MNATMSASTESAIPSVVFSVREIPLDKICESKTNPRREFDETKLAELADSIRQHGVLQAVVVRPRPESATDVTNSWPGRAAIGHRSSSGGKPYPRISGN